MIELRIYAGRHVTEGNEVVDRVAEALGVLPTSQVTATLDRQRQVPCVLATLTYVPG